MPRDKAVNRPVCAPQQTGPSGAAPSGLFAAFEHLRKNNFAEGQKSY
jgi:hypothetical protein